ncbi:MAG: hypothetical protein ACTMUB_08420 [cyanobacterium endosymbiont of Rhopalodia musculus]|uniref:hypothetical protein n=1 Tax=cyanobacterium endosymbiont of Epithemia clementina EcSB TaxID=3034674 RepID=UPI0024810045|nr:hypothetical protein [cyanobacterium endosymbiont of Epithemia clementina EcSB]WGT68099.1 hypothetical protein P3F56_03215 [cyanobacterium endosymbiont of Epithemia clementina EcSB]
MKTSTKGQKAQEEQSASVLSVKEKTIYSPHGLQLIVEKDHLPRNCPIEASHLNVVRTYGAVGSNCPVLASGMDVIGILTISGQRPIMASHLQVNETHAVMENRPVASNEVDNSELLIVSKDSSGF